MKTYLSPVQGPQGATYQEPGTKSHSCGVQPSAWSKDASIRRASGSVSGLQGLARSDFGNYSPRDFLGYS